MSLFRGRDDFQETIEAAGRALGIDAAIVEKDYWVSEVLRVLTRDFPGDFIFKGGTSLSKCYGLIKRFSEDVDILILPGDRGVGATDRLMKDMAEASGKALGAEPERLDGTTGRNRTVRLTYPTTRIVDGISPGVLLEMGIRGGEHPWEMMPAGCLLADVLKDSGQDISDYEDLQPVDVPVLQAGRTLLEKLAVLHTRLSSDATADNCAKYGRHYLDIYQLLADARVLSMLDNRDEVELVIASVQRITNEFFRPRQDTITKEDSSAELPDVEIRPEGGWASSPAFDASNSRLATGYVVSMRRLYLGNDDPPQFAEICARVRAVAHLL